MVRDSSLTHSLWGFDPMLTIAVQVLFKRKPVQFLPVPEIHDENQEVCSSRRAFWWAVVDLNAAEI